MGIAPPRLMVRLLDELGAHHKDVFGGQASAIFPEGIPSGRFPMGFAKSTIGERQSSMLFRLQNDGRDFLFLDGLIECRKILLKYLPVLHKLSFQLC